jgi:hypothetical protein
MSKRYYISDIVYNDDLGWTTKALAEAGQGVRVVADIPSGPDGRPLHTQALCLVAAKDHARFVAIEGVDALPDFPLDGKVSAINTVTLNATKSMLRRRGLSDAIVDGKDGYRDLIRAAGRAFKPDFDENKFDVTDV